MSVEKWGKDYIPETAEADFKAKHLVDPYRCGECKSKLKFIEIVSADNYDNPIRYLLIRWRCRKCKETQNVLHSLHPRFGTYPSDVWNTCKPWLSVLSHGSKYEKKFEKLIESVENGLNHVR